MNAIKDVHDFKMFLKNNRERIYENAINASDISSQDEWMKESKWDDIYRNEETSYEKSIID